MVNRGTVTCLALLLDCPDGTCPAEILECNEVVNVWWFDTRQDESVPSSYVQLCGPFVTTGSVETMEEILAEE